MPIIKNAIKKMRQDQMRTLRNQGVKSNLKTVLQKAKTASPEDISKAFSALDRAAKKNLIHPNKAARQKSRLAKLVKLAVKETPAKKTAKSRGKKAKA